jgi:TolB-like protein/DNA-binding winged helix-turn-helix (wHTH) protein
MPAPASSPERVQFGVFELDLQRAELRKSGVKVRLQEQPLKILQVLLENPGQIVSREQLQKRIWPANTFVEFDQGLYSAMARLRDALGDSSDSPRFIETVARRGYRFIAPVTEAADEQRGRATDTAPRPENYMRKLAVSVLAGLFGGALLLGLFLGFDIGGAREWLRRHSNRPIRSIAVLPLQNLSNDPQQDYFADGMTDELTTELAQVGSLRVISRTSAMQYKATKKSLPQIARELNVDAVVEGSVVRSGDRVRITAQLVDAATDQHLWASSYDRDLRDILLVQAEAARSITDSIRVRLTPQQAKRLARAHPVDPEAYDLYLRGRYYSEKITQPDIKKCVENFQLAIQKDPLFADAYAGLGDCYALDADFGGLNYSDPISRQRKAVARALELDDAQAEAHAQLGALEMEQDWNWASAATEFQRALELGPNLPATHDYYSDFLLSTGHTDAAIKEVQVAIGLDPLSTRYKTELGWVLLYARRYDEAIRQFRRITELDPNHINAHMGLERVYMVQGMYEPAIEEKKWVFMLFGFDASEQEAKVSELRRAYRASGPRGYWQKRLEWDKQDVRDIHKAKEFRFVRPFYVAVDYAYLGDKDRAFSCLQQAYQQHAGELAGLKIDPRFDSLRSDPRFVDLLRRVGLSQ